MTLLIDNRTKTELKPEFEELFQKTAAQCLEFEKYENECEISLSLVEGGEMRDINRRYRGIDNETDVLSFPQISFGTGDEECAAKNENGEVILGDIIIYLKRAEEQAQEYSHSLTRELSFLTAHSMLHLLGYDHETAEEEKIMFSKQEEILDMLGIGR